MDTTRIAVATVTTLTIAGLGLKRKWLTPAAALSACPIGFVIAFAGNEYMMMLLVFFVSGSLATKFNARVMKARAAAIGAHQEEIQPKVSTTPSDAVKGRTVMQVVATAGIPAVLCSASTVLPHNVVFPSVLGYFACGAGDTLASEFGELSSETPVLITTLQAAPVGRDGAVSLQGVAASILGGGMIGLSTGNWNAVLPGILCGWFGSYVDSLMGAIAQTPGLSIQSGMMENNWKMYNSLVNAASSMVTSLVGVCLWNNEEYLYPTAIGLSAFTGLIGLQIRKAKKD